MTDSARFSQLILRAHESIEQAQVCAQSRLDVIMTSEPNAPIEAILELARTIDTLRRTAQDLTGIVNAQHPVTRWL